MKSRPAFALFALVLLLSSCAVSEPVRYDTILRGGTVYDGNGGDPFIADVAIDGDRIAMIGDLSAAVSDNEVDVAGLAVSPGFIM